MSTIKDGGPAYPAQERIDYSSSSVIEYYPGMSLRDHFAAGALPAVLAAYIEANGRCLGTDHIANNCAAHAYRIADAMLRARDQGPS